MEKYRIEVSTKKEREKVVAKGIELGYEVDTYPDHSEARVIWMEENGPITSLGKTIDDFCAMIPDGGIFRALCLSSPLISIKDFLKLEVSKC